MAAFNLFRVSLIPAGENIPLTEAQMIDWADRNDDFSADGVVLSEWIRTGEIGSTWKDLNGDTFTRIS